MTESLLPFYPWIKALHVIAVIAWMAGLLYLPRLFVYHCEAEAGSRESETFKTMEEKLARVIMQPAMIATLFFGFVMIAIPGTPGYVAQAGFWLWLKLVFVVGLLVAHVAMMHWKNDFSQNRNQHPQRFFRIVNEIPTLLMIGIVICVVVKPF
jgi:putative membrane protein